MHANMRLKIKLFLKNLLLFIFPNVSDTEYLEHFTLGTMNDNVSVKKCL